MMSTCLEDSLLSIGICIPIHAPFQTRDFFFLLHMVQSQVQKVSERLGVGKRKCVQISEICEETEERNLSDASPRDASLPRPLVLR